MLNTNRKRHWVVILFSEIYSVVVLDEHDKEKFYWDGTCTWCTMSNRDKAIARDYGYISEMDDKAIEDLYLDFYNSFNLPKKEVVQMGGWLAPNGDFYPCRYGGHSGLAHQLCAIIYKKLEDDTFLNRSGWVHISDDGTYLWREPVPTKRQAETLFELIIAPATEWTEKEYSANIREGLEYMDMERNL